MSRQLAELEAREFLDAIRRRTRSIHPETFAQEVARTLLRVTDRPEELPAWPPHHLFHALEACCAFFNPHYQKEFRERDFVRLINEYKDHYAPAMRFYLQESGAVDLFLINTMAQQFPFQTQATAHDFGRSLLIFTEKTMPRSHEAFAATYGFSFVEWQAFCFYVYSFAVVSKDAPRPIKIGPFTPVDPELLRPEATAPIFRELATNRLAVHDRFHKLRNDPRFRLHEQFLRSSFERAPLFQIRDHEVIAIYPPWVARRATEGLYDLLDDLSATEFGEELGDSFEEYVAKLMGELRPDCLLHESDLLAILGPQEVADMVVCTPDAVFVIECKATGYSALTYSENAIRGDNSTGKLLKAHRQLAATIKAISDGRLAHRIGDVASKAICPLVITLKWLYGANSRKYRELISQRAIQEGSPLEPLATASTVQVLSVAELEWCIVLARDSTLWTVVTQKLAQDGGEFTDWGPWLLPRLGGNRLEPLIDEFTALADRLKGAIQRPTQT